MQASEQLALASCYRVLVIIYLHSIVNPTIPTVIMRVELIPHQHKHAAVTYALYSTGRWTWTCTRTLTLLLLLLLSSLLLLLLVAVAVALVVVCL